MTIEDAHLSDLADKVGRHLTATSRRLVTAESCTGGWIGKALTDIAGSSGWFLGGAIVYSNALKQKLLDVGAGTLARYGAVSEATVCEMAEGALVRLGGDVAVAVSGVAGPDGGTQEKPVGTVCFAWSCGNAGHIATITYREVFSGDREQVRRQTVAVALERILAL